MEIDNKYQVKDWDYYYHTEKKMHIKSGSGFFIPYDIFLCDAILNKYLPKYNIISGDNMPKVCEIGCGDGKLVKKISHRFGYKPFGIEYSSIAANAARQIGVTVIEGDAFSMDIQNRYREYFDIIYSYGFIEHINPVEKAIDIHLSLLKPGGYFFIQIPRIKGFNYWKFKFFRPDLISLHNLDIMEDTKLAALCNRPNVEKLFCRNYGTFKLRVPMDKKTFKYYLLTCLCFGESLSSPLFRLFFRDHGFETKFFSPSIIFIGKKLY